MRNKKITAERRSYILASSSLLSYFKCSDRLPGLFPCFRWPIFPLQLVSREEEEGLIWTWPREGNRSSETGYQRSNGLETDVNCKRQLEDLQKHPAAECLFFHADCRANLFLMRAQSCQSAQNISLVFWCCCLGMHFTHTLKPIIVQKYVTL